jgi:hypothetical protein
MKRFEYRKIDDLYWQVVSDWLTYHAAEIISGEVSNDLCGKSIEASIMVARHRDNDLPCQHLVDIWFDSEADEAEFIMKEIDYD